MFRIFFLPLLKTFYLPKVPTRLRFLPENTPKLKTKALFLSQNVMTDTKKFKKNKISLQNQSAQNLKFENPNFYRKKTF